MKESIKEKLVRLFTDKIEKEGVLPWSKGFLNKQWLPMNPVTKTQYRGVNLFTLAIFGSRPYEFMTFNQVRDAGGKVKKGAKSIPIVYWNVWNKKEHRNAQEGDDEGDLTAFLRHYNVFRVGEDTEGIEAKRKLVTKDNPHNEEAERFIARFFEATGLKRDARSSTERSCAFYRPSEHLIYLPPLNEFTSTERYLATAFHEMVHSTARAMGRKLNGRYDMEGYSKEEVVAEFGAALLCAEFGIEGQEDNAAAYLQNWSERLKENPDWLIHGASAAQKAVEYMLDVVKEVA